MTNNENKKIKKLKQKMEICVEKIQEQDPNPTKIKQIESGKQKILKTKKMKLKY